ncbi:Chitinase 1, partial [Cladochytrium tenue]
MSQFGDSSLGTGSFAINLSDKGGYNSATGNIWGVFVTGSDGYSQIEKDIIQCRALGVKVLLALGGGTSDYGVASGTGPTLATNLTTLFFSAATSSNVATRPFRTAVLDGIDIDLENGKGVAQQADLLAFVNKLRSLNPSMLIVAIATLAGSPGPASPSMSSAKTSSKGSPKPLSPRSSMLKTPRQRKASSQSIFSVPSVSVTASAMGLPPPVAASLSARSLTRSSTSSRRSADKRFSSSSLVRMNSERRSPNKKGAVTFLELDESQKWRKEAEKWQDQYERQLVVHKKNMALLEEKIERLDFTLQVALKEKSQLQNNVYAKEKEIADLQQREFSLKNNLAQSDKSSLLLHDKASRAIVLERRISDLQKTTGRIRSVADKKASDVDRLLREREELESLVDSLRLQFEKLSLENSLHADAIQNTEATRSTLETRVSELESLLDDAHKSLEVANGKHEEIVGSLLEKGSSLQVEKEDLERKLANLGAELASARQERDDDRHVVDGLEERIKLGQKQMVDMNLLAERLRLDKSTLEKKIAVATGNVALASQEKETYIKDLERLRAKLASVQTENTMRKDSLSELKTENEDLTEKIAAVEELARSQTAKYGDVINNLNTAITFQDQEKERNAAEMEGQFAQFTHHFKIAMIELEERQQLLEQAASVEDQLRLEASRLENDLSAANEIDILWQEKIRHLESARSELEGSVKSLEADYVATRSELIESSRKLAETFAQRELLEGDVSTLRAHLDGYKSELESIQNEHDLVMQDQAAQIADLTDHLENIQQVRDADREAAETHVESVKAASDALLASRSACIVELESRIIDILAQLEEKQGELVRMTEKNRHELGQAKYSLVEAEEMLEEYKERAQDADQALEEARSEMELLRQARTADRERFDAELASGRAAHERVIDGLDLKLSSLEDTLGHLESSQNHVDFTVVEQTSVASESTKVDDMAYQSNDGRSHVKSLEEGELSFLSSRLISVDGKVDALLSTLETDREMIAKLNSHIDTGSEMLPKSSFEYGELAHELRRELETVASGPEAVKSESQSYKEALELTQSEMAVLERLLIEEKEARAATEAQLRGLHELVSSEHHALELSNAAVADLAGKLAQESASLAELRAELENVTVKLSKEKAAHSETLGRIDALEKTLPNSTETSRLASQLKTNALNQSLSDQETLCQQPSMRSFEARGTEDSREAAMARLAEVRRELEAELAAHDESRLKLSTLETALAEERKAHKVAAEAAAQLRDSLSQERVALEHAEADGLARRQSYAVHLAELRAKMAELEAALGEEVARGRAKEERIASLGQQLAGRFGELDRERRASAALRERAVADAAAQAAQAGLVASVSERDTRNDGLEEEAAEAARAAEELAASREEAEKSRRVSLELRVQLDAARGELESVRAEID